MSSSTSFFRLIYANLIFSQQTDGSENNLLYVSRVIVSSSKQRCLLMLQDPVVSDGASVHREDGGGLRTPASGAAVLHRQRLEVSPPILLPRRRLSRFLTAALLPVLRSRLDPILYKKCQGDASRICHTHGWNETNEMMPPGAIFSCLYRHAYRTVEQGRRVSPRRRHTEFRVSRLSGAL